MADIFKKEYAGSMDSKYYFSSEKTPAGKVGATASPQTPNQIGELTSRLNQGLKAVEIGTMNQRLLDQIPEEHFNEIRRMNKLTGSEATLHAPIQDLDLAGFSQQGWNEFDQKESIEKLKSSIDRAHKMDINGNIPITVHAGSFPAQKWKKEDLFKGGEIKEGQKPLKDQRSEMVIVNQETGEIQSVRYKERDYMSGKKVAWTPEYSLNNRNVTSWDQEQLQLMQLKKDLTEVEDRFEISKGRYAELAQGAEKKILTKKEQDDLKKIKQEEETVQHYSEEIYSNMRSLVEDMYSRYNKFKPKPKNEIERDKEEVFKKNMKLIAEEEKKLEKSQEELQRLSEKRKTLKEGTEQFKETTNKLHEKWGEITDRRQQQTESIVSNFHNSLAPNTWVAADDFAKDKVSDSVAEAASYAYKQYGEKAPIISVENVYPEFALSRGESLKDTIESAKKKFSDKLAVDKGMSKKKAEEMANKIIGITWDVGHIYMLKKHGYTDEDIAKEAKKVGAHVTHIHLTDNFGFEDSHLPPGEGSVNIKEQLKAIEESMTDERKGKVKSIVEAGEFVANFKEVPHLYALSNLNSPLYTEDVGPTWDSIWDTHGHYLGGFGEMMPQKYFDLYGAPGFAQLPRELGGGAGAPDRGRFAASGGGEDDYAQAA